MTFVKFQKCLSSILFADDTNLLCRHSNLNELVRMTNAGLDQHQVWFSENQLFLNVMKSD